MDGIALRICNRGHLRRERRAPRASTKARIVTAKSLARMNLVAELLYAYSNYTPWKCRRPMAGADLWWWVERGKEPGAPIENSAGLEGIMRNHLCGPAWIMLQWERVRPLMTSMCILFVRHLLKTNENILLRFQCFFMIVYHIVVKHFNHCSYRFEPSICAHHYKYYNDQDDNDYNQQPFHFRPL